RETWPLSYGGLDREWVSYPGVFSHGRLDPGTRLLLDSMGSAGIPAHGSRILDYGCGSGVIAGVVDGWLEAGTGDRDRTADPGLHLLDADAIALEAARENVPGGRWILADGLADLDGVYDLIVSNPPYHRGKAEERRVLNALVRGAPSRLEQGGALVMVVQRRFSVEVLLERSFHGVEILGEDSTYRVWRGEGPRLDRRR
ncbi:MAG: class I SAM-dependent methyltransferase, partial [Gemmatimonadota bacterium]